MMTRHVLIVNSGDITAVPASMDAVGDGLLAIFGGAEGADWAAIDLAADAVPASFQIVRGGDPIRKSGLLRADRIISVTKRAYRAPANQVSTISGVTASDGTAGIRIEDLSDDYKQFASLSYEAPTLSTDSVPSIIAALASAVNSNPRSVVQANTNKATTVTLTGTSGTANINVLGTNYLATFDTTLTETADDFVDSHAATILAAHNLVVEAAAGVLTFTAGPGMDEDFTAPTAATVSGDLDGTTATSQAIDELILTSKVNSTSFSTALYGSLQDATLTATTAWDAGSGTGAQVAEDERVALFVMTGDGNYISDGILGRPAAPDQHADTSKTYTVYTIRHRSGQPGVGVGNALDANDIEQIQICLASSGVTGDLDTAFAAYLQDFDA